MSRWWHILGTLSNTLLKALRCYVNRNCVEQLDFKSVLYLPVIPLFFFLWYITSFFKGAFVTSDNIHYTIAPPCNSNLVRCRRCVCVFATATLLFRSMYHSVFPIKSMILSTSIWAISTVILLHQNQLEMCHCLQQVQFCHYAELVILRRSIEPVQES